MRAVVPLVLALASSLAGCERDRKSAPPAEAPPIAIGTQVTVRTDAVGIDPACQPSPRRHGDKIVPYVPLACVGKATTFVLVHADNGDDHDAIVTLGGVLVDADGHEVGRLKPAALRIPAHGRRTFALVDAEGQRRPTATDARIDLRAAAPARHPDPVRIVDGEVTQADGKVVASGSVENLTDAPAQAVIIAGFQDPAGKPLTRPFQLFDLKPREKKPVTFTGPPGTATGYIFVGQVEF